MTAAVYEVHVRFRAWARPAMRALGWLCVALVYMRLQRLALRLLNGGARAIVRWSAYYPGCEARGASCGHVTIQGGR